MDIKYIYSSKTKRKKESLLVQLKLPHALFVIAVDAENKVFIPVMKPTMHAVVCFLFLSTSGFFSF